MAKYSVECPTCNTTYTVRLDGNKRDRQWKLDKWDWTCDGCREKARQAENSKAAAANVDAGLPALTGTEKQIAWAETIRAEKIKEIDSVVASYGGRLEQLFADNMLDKADEQARKDGFASLEDAFSCGKEAAEALKGQTSAHWWIDNRDTRIGHILAEKAKDIAKARKDRTPQAMDAIAEATIRPESPKTETVAEIRVHDGSVEVLFPEKHYEFWQIIKKQLHFEWTGSAWKRTIKATNGTPPDRAAEAGNKLLAAGFCVRIFDPAVRELAINGTFEPECTRWIMKRTSGTYNGWFAITWDEDNRKIYDSARKLRGSKWDKPAVVVPAEQFEDVEDFAALYGFRLSSGAQELAAEARRVRDAALVANVAPVADNRPPVPGDKPERLDVPESVEVSDEFKEIS